MLSIIAAQSRNHVIGRDGDLPWHLPADLRHFRQLTSGHTVIMGRKTFDSIVSRLGHPLPGRRNVVLTRDRMFHYPGVDTVHDIDALDQYNDAFVIGGEQVYRVLFDRAIRLYITEVAADVMGDTYFPTINPHDWREISRETHAADATHEYDYAFVEYERV